MLLTNNNIIIGTGVITIISSERKVLRKMHGPVQNHNRE